MSADAGADQRAMTALQARVSEALAQLARTDAEIVKLKGQVSALSGRVIALENPADPMDRAARGLADMEASLPLYAEALTQAEVAERKRLTDVE